MAAAGAAGVEENVVKADVRALIAASRDWSLRYLPQHLSENRVKPVFALMEET